MMTDSLLPSPLIKVESYTFHDKISPLPSRTIAHTQLQSQFSTQLPRQLCLWSLLITSTSFLIPVPADLLFKTAPTYLCMDVDHLLLPQIGPLKCSG